MNPMVRQVRYHLSKSRYAAQIVSWCRALSGGTRLSIAFGLIAVTGIAANLAYQNHQYDLDASEQKLLSRVSVDVSKMKTTKAGFVYDRSSEKPKQGREVTVAAAGDSTGQFPYKVELPKNIRQGMTYSDSRSGLSFKMTPLYAADEGRTEEGRIIYPKGSNETHVYTLKRNGVKEDILLAKAPKGGNLELDWKLELPDTLEARLMPEGSVGIYSANAYLYGAANTHIADDKSRRLIDNAKTKGKKDNLVFLLPAPYIVDSSNKRDYRNASFRLDQTGKTLTLQAQKLEDKQYPLSIDPSVVVTTTADFKAGSDEGMIDYGTADQINQRTPNTPSTGTLGTSYFNTPRSNHAVTAANGYLYISGGTQSASNTACVNTGTADTRCNDIQRMAINTDGSLGTISTSYFNTPRSNHTMTAANGYLYIAGGFQSASNTACVNTGTAIHSCNDIQRFSIDPSTGALTAPASNTSHFNTPRYTHAMTAVNGYLYISGGTQSNTDTACVNTGTADFVCNDIQRYSIAASNGALTALGTSYFNTPRDGHAMTASNGYLYISGGLQTSTNTACVNTGTASDYCNDIQRMAINADGSLGLISTSYFNTPRHLHAMTAANGYLYIAGGFQSASNTACVNTGVANQRCNDIQRMAINADGSLGLISTSHFNTSRYAHAVMAANGYLYLSGGIQSASDTACVNTGTNNSRCNDIQRMAVNADGSLGVISTSYFNTPRERHAMTVANGYLYISGGFQSASNTACVNTGTATQHCNDIQRFSIDPSTGALTAPSPNTSYFNQPRNSHTMTAANGYLYIAGGFIDTTSTVCKNTDTGSQRCNDIQRMAIASDGSLGTILTSHFNTPRSSHAMTSSNGYLYISGGQQANSDTACVNTGVANQSCNDIQRMAINADGSL